jgi:3-deoxy-7-phosphoheptulonate synthase
MTTPEPVLKSHRRAGVSTTIVPVGSVRFGDGSYPVIAGPTAVEDESQIMSVGAAIAAAGGSVLRAGTFVAGTSPYGFRGLGADALLLLQLAGREVDLPTATEVLDTPTLAVVAEHVDLLEIGPDNMQNFSLLRAVGETGKPALLHRGSSATIDEWLMAAEYILDGGSEHVVLCERGSRGFDPRTSETIDISAVPVVQQLTHLPVVVDPSPAAGGGSILGPLALAARSAGADGLIVAVHPDPPAARAGNGSQLTPEAFERLMASLGIPSLRDEIDRIDRELLKLVARRLRGSVDIAKMKATRNLALHSPLREQELIDEAVGDGKDLGLEPEYVRALLELILEHSRAAQRRAVGEE